MPRGPRYPDATKDAAIAHAAEHGAHAAAERYGIKATTIRSWCSRAGIAAQRNERTAAAVEACKLTFEERKTRLALRFVELAEMSADRAAEVIGQASLHDVVGAWDYAIKNAQLLSGAATARTEHTAGKEAAHTVADELAARRTKAA